MSRQKLSLPAITGKEVEVEIEDHLPGIGILEIETTIAQGQEIEVILGVITQDPPAGQQVEVEIVTDTGLDITVEIGIEVEAEIDQEVDTEIITMTSAIKEEIDIEVIVDPGMDIEVGVDHDIEVEVGMEEVIEVEVGIEVDIIVEIQVGIGMEIIKMEIEAMVSLGIRIMTAIKVKTPTEIHRLE